MLAETTRLVAAPVLLVLGVTLVAQQGTDPPAVQAGAREMPVPALVDLTAPPPEALLGFWYENRSVASVTLEVLVGREGVVEDVRILQPDIPPPDVVPEPPRQPPPADLGRLEPLPTSRNLSSLLVLVPGLAYGPNLRGAASATRQWVMQWRFAPPAADDPATPVVVPVTLEVDMAGELSFFPERLGPDIDTTVPPDFALVYRFGRCEFDTRTGIIRSPRQDRAVEVSAEDRQTIYTELLRVGFFGYPPSITASRLRQEQPEPVVEHRDTGVVVGVRLRPVGGRVLNTLPTYNVEVLRNGEWTRVSWIGNAEDNRLVLPEAEGVSRIRGLLGRIVERVDTRGLECTFIL